MHILVVNDDGPPSCHASPYVHSLVRELQASGHTVSVCLPHTQRSWIGKAHIIGETVTPHYYQPPPAHALPAGLGLSGPGGQVPGHDGTIHTQPQPARLATDAERQTGSAEEGNWNSGQEANEWILVDGTPASCVQLGLYHLFRHRGPIDLVISGPNYGRNTTAVFALSSGTLGGALEAACCRHRAIALSFAVFPGHDARDPEVMAKASRHSVRVVHALVRDWPADGSVDLYSVNVPLTKQGLQDGKVLWAGMLQNYWREGSCFEKVNKGGLAREEHEDEEEIREGQGGEKDAERGAMKLLARESDTPGSFKWAPRFVDVYKSVDEAPPGNDGWAVREGHTSVTPLKANFWQARTELQGQELQI